MFRGSELIFFFGNCESNLEDLCINRKLSLAQCETLMMQINFYYKQLKDDKSNFRIFFFTKDRNHFRAPLIRIIYGSGHWYDSYWHLNTKPPSLVTIHATCEIFVWIIFMAAHKSFQFKICSLHGIFQEAISLRNWHQIFKGQVSFKFA